MKSILTLALAAIVSGGAAIEVEAFDAQLGSLLEALESSGGAANTLVIVTSHHGMSPITGHSVVNLFYAIPIHSRYIRSNP